MHTLYTKLNCYALRFPRRDPRGDHGEWGRCVYINVVLARPYMQSTAMRTIQWIAG